MEPLKLEEFAECLASLPCDSRPVEEQDIYVSEGEEEVRRKKGEGWMKTDGSSSVQTRVDLLLSEIASEKKRRSDWRLYQEALTLKLTEFIDYIIGEDDRFIGLSLPQKVTEILRNLGEFKGKTIDGWVKMVLIEVFLEELRDLQREALEHLEGERRRSQQSQLEPLSSSHIQHISRYSEPNSGRFSVDE